jgi:cobalt/nickel transport system permease protein
MAILMPFAGLAVYRLIARDAPLTSRRRVVAAGIAGYVGINVAALATAIEFGIQPALFHTASGAPLYSPYSLSQTIPAMALAHLTIAGAAEAILTAGVLAYLARADVRRLVPNHPGVPVSDDGTAPRPPARLTPARVAVGFVALMVLLTPLGLLAPGGAFGEDAPQDLDVGALGLSAVPAGLSRYNGFWSHTLLGGYGFADGQNATLAYWLSAVIGIAVIALAIWLLATVVRRVARARGAQDGDGEDVAASRREVPAP